MKYVIAGRAFASRSRILLLSGVIGAAMTAGVCGAAIAQTTTPQPSPQSPEAAATSSAPAQSAKPKADPEDKVVCRYQEEIGSRLGSTKVCHTKREWEQLSRDASDAVDASQRRH